MMTSAHVFDRGLLDRLMHLSRRNHYDPYQRFNWPEKIDKASLWCNEDLLTTYGTELHASLSKEALTALSHCECIHFFSLNVHGIKGVLTFVMRTLYEKRYSDISEYLHFFVAEENAHMWFFAKFCLDYAGEIYPEIRSPRSEAVSQLEQDLYLFASTLIFEEYVDFYNHKVGMNDSVPAIVREINYQHHVDESRHISFGREVVKRLYGEVLAVDTEGVAALRVRRTIEKIFVYFIGSMYNPRAYADAGLVVASGAMNPAALRNRLRNDPARKSIHLQWFKRTADFFVKQGILSDTTCLSR